MNIISYLNFNELTTEDDILLAKELSVDEVILTKYNGENLLETDTNNIKEFNKILRKNKLNIYGLEADFYNFDFENEETVADAFVYYENAFAIANQLRAKRTIITLPLISDILLKHDEIINVLKRLVSVAKKHRQTIMFKQGLNRNSTITYLLKKNRQRDLKLLFEPAQVSKNGESVLVAFRLYKKYFEDIIVSDLDSLNNSELIGYGKVGLIDLFKRMRRDRFDGNLILDPGFVVYSKDFIPIVEEEKKVSFVKRFFTRKPKVSSYLEGFGQRIFPNENKTPTIKDIYESQIKALKIIFNLR